MSRLCTLLLLIGALACLAAYAAAAPQPGPEPNFFNKAMKKIACTAGAPFAAVMPVAGAACVGSG